MKLLIASSLLIASTSFAQSIDVAALKNLMTAKQATLEKVNAGMAKRIVTLSRVATELGPCEMTMTAVQTILKVEGTKIIVHSKENYVPASTPACAGFESSDVAVLFYEDKPTLANDLSDLNESASQIKAISRAGDLVTMNLTVAVTNDDQTTRTENVTVKYDLSKPSFKNTILVQDSASKVTTEDISDIDVNSVDLTKVLFCESADSDNCQEGNFSDILF